MREVPWVLITALVFYDFMQITHPRSAFPHLGIKQQLVPIPTSRMSQGIPGQKCDAVRESYVFWRHSPGEAGEKELAFIELLLCSRHFPRISSLNAVVENQGSGVPKLWG